MKAEKVAIEGNMRELYDTTKKPAGNYRKPERPVKIKEISMTIRQIRSGKAAGPDNIPTEALKADVATSASILHILFGEIWDEGQVPVEWKEGLLVKIPKKGDFSKCDNYRGITLLSVP
ncbi:unnamed protein product [Schistosoma mattheei]|uniref:Uncharacterized protein n=1 Tax=Schistosoma mattheei TaxID=31246 RepID=A0A183P6D2_9TREM|nr:unnamed protein product [Schistosoma mattheei]